MVERDCDIRKVESVEKIMYQELEVVESLVILFWFVVESEDGDV